MHPFIQKSSANLGLGIYYHRALWFWNFHCRKPWMLPPSGPDAAANMRLCVQQMLGAQGPTAAHPGSMHRHLRAAGASLGHSRNQGPTALHCIEEKAQGQAELQQGCPGVCGFVLHAERTVIPSQHGIWLWPCPRCSPKEDFSTCSDPFCAIGSWFPNTPSSGKEWKAQICVLLPETTPGCSTATRGATSLWKADRLQWKILPYIHGIFTASLLQEHKRCLNAEL